MNKKQQVVIINYMDGKRDVVQLDNEFTPSLFVDETNVLNVKGRYTGTGGFEWFYFPLCNVRSYKKQDGESA